MKRPAPAGSGIFDHTNEARPVGLDAVRSALRCASIYTHDVTVLDVHLSFPCRDAGDGILAVSGLRIGYSEGQEPSARRTCANFSVSGEGATWSWARRFLLQR